MTFKEVLAGVLGCTLHQAVAAEARRVELRTLDPRVVCTASDNYCKVAMKVAYTYRARVAAGQASVPVECTARVAIRRAGDEGETVQTFTQALRTAVNYGAIDQDVELVLKPPLDTTSMQLKDVACSAQLD